MCFACSSRCDSARKCVFWVKAWQFGDSVLCHGVILGFVLSDSRFCVSSLEVLRSSVVENVSFLEECVTVA